MCFQTRVSNPTSHYTRGPLYAHMVPYRHWVECISIDWLGLLHVCVVYSFEQLYNSCISYLRQGESWVDSRKEQLKKVCQGSWCLGNQFKRGSRAGESKLWGQDHCPIKEPIKRPDGGVVVLVQKLKDLCDIFVINLQHFGDALLFGQNLYGINCFNHTGFAQIQERHLDITSVMMWLSEHVESNIAASRAHHLGLPLFPGKSFCQLADLQQDSLVAEDPHLHWGSWQPLSAQTKDHCTAQEKRKYC